MSKLFIILSTVFFLFGISPVLAEDGNMGENSTNEIVKKAEDTNGYKEKKIYNKSYYSDKEFEKDFLEEMHKDRMMMRKMFYDKRGGVMMHMRVFCTTYIINTFLKWILMILAIVALWRWIGMQKKGRK